MQEISMSHQLQMIPSSVKVCLYICTCIISIIASVNKVFEEWDEPNVFDWQRYANGNRTMESLAHEQKLLNNFGFYTL